MQQQELTFMEAVKKVYLKNYCNFSGRASRSEFWWAFLAQYILMMAVYFVVFFITMIITILLSTSSGNHAASGIAVIIGTIPMILLSMALILPVLGVTVRRLHDTGRSGWYYLICLIPIVGFIIYYWLALPSEMCENEYGPVPNLIVAPWDNNTFTSTNNY